MDLSLATLASYPKSRTKVYNLKSVDTLFGESRGGTCKRNHVDLREYLQLFADDTQSLSKRTLVIFSAIKYLKDIPDILDILYKLQTENNVVVIIVFYGYGYNIINYSQQFVPRHLTFFVYTGFCTELIGKQIVDVIKNPNFNRFEFGKSLAGFKDRICWENVKGFLASFASIDYLLEKEKVDMAITSVESILPLIYRSDGNITLQILTIDGLYDDKISRFIPLHKTDVMKGTERKAFFLFFSGRNLNESADERMLAIGQILGKNKQIVKSITIYIFLFELEGNGIYRYEGGNEKKISMHDIMDDLGCELPLPR